MFHIICRNSGDKLESKIKLLVSEAKSKKQLKSKKLPEQLVWQMWHSFLWLQSNPARQREGTLRRFRLFHSSLQVICGLKDFAQKSHSIDGLTVFPPITISWSCKDSCTQTAAEFFPLADLLREQQILFTRGSLNTTSCIQMQPL